MAKEKESQQLASPSTAEKPLEVAPPAKRPLEVASTANKKQHHQPLKNPPPESDDDEEVQTKEEEEDETDSSSEEEEEPKDSGKNPETPSASAPIVTVTANQSADAESELETESESDSDSLKEEGDWFKKSFLVGEMTSLDGVDEASLKERWSMVPTKTKKKIVEKWKLLQANEYDSVLLKADLLREVSSVIAQAD